MAARNRGVTVIEIVIGVAIFGLVVALALQTTALFFKTTRVAREDTRALYAAEAGLEMLQFLRSEAWANISAQPADTDRYLLVATTSLAITTTPEVMADGYTRGFLLHPVYRDSAGDWVASTTPGSSVDPDSREVEVWVNHDGRTVTLFGFLSNLHDE